MPNEPKQKKRSNQGRRLRETLGFDLTVYVRDGDYESGGYYSVRCSQCSALATNVELGGKLSKLEEQYQILARSCVAQAVEITRLKETK